MEIKKHRDFNLLTLPTETVHGDQILLEASAGTGKTFSMAALVLRLVAEGTAQVGEILAVTFTRAATAELKGRIRRFITGGSAYLGGVAGDGHALEKNLIQVIENAVRKAGPRGREVVGRRLEEAGAQLDEAQVYTIHGFCQRVLGEFAFETGAPGGQTLVESQDELIAEAVAHFWRRRVLSLSPLEYTVLRDTGKFSLKNLTQLARVILAKPALFLGELPASPPALPDLVGAWAEDGERTLKFFIDCESADYLNGNTAPKCLRNLAAIASVFRQPGAPGLPDALATVEELGEKKYLGPESNLLKKSGKEAYPEGVESPFLEACGHFEAATQPWSRYYWRLFATTFRDSFAKLKGRRLVMSFDDMLLGLHRSLQDPMRRGALRLAVQGRTRVVLIDEFQDTDPLQYEIFKGLFAGRLMVMVGDPKQSIYRFRGADLVNYRKARDEGKAQTYTLGENFRSSETLVGALNDLFGSMENPFLDEGVHFEPVAAVKKDGAQKGAGAGLAKPLVLWYFTGQLNKSRWENAVAQQVAGQISKLLVGENSPGSPGPVAPRDMAVLLPTTRHAQIVQGYLERAGIPCIFGQGRSVYDSAEAVVLHTALAAMINPKTEGVRAALLTPLFGLGLPEVEALEGDERALEKWLATFRSLGDLWRRRGVLPLITRLLAREGFRRGGRQERAFTNYRHLGELLARAGAHEPGPERQLVFLAEAMAGGSEGAEQAEERLESDGDAVTLMTIHKSKGLEFNTVFVPYLITRSTHHSDHAKDPWMIHHEGALESFYPLAEDEDVSRTGDEDRQEGMRLAYVALTRGAQRVYTAWGDFTVGVKVPWWTAGARLFADDDQDTKEPLDFAGVQEKLAGQKHLDLQRVGRHSVASGALAPRVADLPRGPQLPQGLGARLFEAQTSTRFGVTSYSGLVGGHEGPRGEGFEDPLKGAPGKNPYPHLPRTNTTGNLVHEILEALDFTRELKWEELEVFAARHFPQAVGQGPFQQDLLQLLEDLRGARMGGTLVQEMGSARKTELEFLLPLGKRGREDLAKLLTHLRGRLFPRFRGNAVVISPEGVEGYLKGIIDLVWCDSRGAWHVTDWKTNTLAAYDQSHLEEAMVQNGYDIQALVYGVAVRRLLSVRVPGFDAERDLGDTSYVFLRGLSGGEGVLDFWVPPEIIGELDQFLTGGN